MADTENTEVTTVAKKVKRSDFATFLNVAPGEATENFKRMGKGITSQKVAYNPATTTETYIDEDSATTTIDSYAPSINSPQTAYVGDPVFDYVDGLRQSRAVGADCETELLLVYVYDSTTLSGSTSYKAEKQKVSIQIDEFGGEGGQPNVLTFTINFIGDAVQGTCTIASGVPTFTANT